MVPVPVNKAKGKGKGKSGGKGFRRKADIGNKAAKEKKIWIGGLPTIEDREKRKEASKKLQEHLKKKGDCKFAEIWPNGVGVAVYMTEEEASKKLQEHLKKKG